MKQGGRVMILDEKSTEKLYNRLRLEESDESTYKIAFESEKGTLALPLPRGRANPSKDFSSITFEQNNLETSNFA